MRYEILIIRNNNKYDWGCSVEHGKSLAIGFMIIILNCYFCRHYCLLCPEWILYCLPKYKRLLCSLEQTLFGLFLSLILFRVSYKMVVTRVALIKSWRW